MSSDQTIGPSNSSPNPDEIIPDPAQEDNNVVSTNQNEPDNNGSITIPPQPQQQESTHANPQAPASSGHIPESTTTTTTTTNDSGPGGSTQAILNLISRELEYIKGTSKTLSEYKDLVGARIPGAEEKIAKIDRELKKVIISVETAESDKDKESHKKQIEEIQKELRQFKKHVRKLKLTIPPKFKIDPADLPALEQHLSNSKKSVQPYTINDKPLSGKLELFKEKIKNEYRSAFQDFLERYAALDNKLKLCLLCFSVFPENEKIKKRLMVYWWIGEGFITPLNEKEKEREREKEQDLEQLGAKCFDELINKDFIHSADGKGSQEVDNCKMQPFVRWAVILMAEKAKFFKFDFDGNPTEDYYSSTRACLVGNGLDIEKNPDLEKLHMLFNVNEAILELKPEWFLKMKNVSVLCLGRWQAAAGHHIEVEETKFLEGLKNMIHLRYLSLQGISRIIKLPNSVTNLGKLTILDLRACHNLEAIPHDIGLLKWLTHLDLSECYLLANMPRGLSQLANLLVLKGFLVTQDKTSCSLNDLTKLAKLRKLSIFTGVMSFPESKDLEAFPKFKVLRKLKIVWGGGAEKSMSPDKKGQEPVASNEKKEGKSEGESKEVAKQENNTVSSRAIDTQTPANVGDNRQNPTKSTPQPLARTSSKLKTALGLATEHGVPVNPGLPTQLKKLDLQCIPMKSAPNWLQPTKLECLKKLYIRGGQLRDLNTADQKWEVKPWSVETLRLKYLTGLGMNWTELLDLFPNLIYLEKVRCPKLTLFPCDEAGVWLNKTKIQSTQEIAS